jgi:hypothetical protein
VTQFEEWSNTIQTHRRQFWVTFRDLFGQDADTFDTLLVNMFFSILSSILNYSCISGVKLDQSMLMLVAGLVVPDSVKVG